MVIFQVKMNGHSASKSLSRIVHAQIQSYTHEMLHHVRISWARRKHTQFRCPDLRWKEKLFSIFALREGSEVKHTSWSEHVGSFFGPKAARSASILTNWPKHNKNFQEAEILI